MNKCPNCGAVLNITYDKKICPYCRSSFIREDNAKDRNAFKEGMLLLEHKQYLEAKCKFNNAVSNIWSYIGLYLCNHKLSPVKNGSFIWFPYSYDEDDSNIILFFANASNNDKDVFNNLREAHKNNCKDYYIKAKQEAEAYKIEWPASAIVSIIFMCITFLFTIFLCALKDWPIGGWVFMWIILSIIPLSWLRKCEKKNNESRAVKKRLDDKVKEINNIFHYE